MDKRHRVGFSVLGFGGALCLHFPGLLSLPDARAVYPMSIIGALIQATIVLAIVFGAISDSSGSARCWPLPALRSDACQAQMSARVVADLERSIENSANSRHAISGLTTFPLTSVSLKRRP